MGPRPWQWLTAPYAGQFPGTASAALRSGLRASGPAMTPPICPAPAFPRRRLMRSPHAGRRSSPRPMATCIPASRQTWSRPRIGLVASLISGYRNGTASHGRMFLPGVNAPLDNATGRISSTYRTNISTAFQTFVNGVNTDTVPGSAGKMILVGRAAFGTLSPHEAKNAYVTGLKIGDLYDTQRRRRNGIRETYAALGVA